MILKNMELSCLYSASQNEGSILSLSRYIRSISVIRVLTAGCKIYSYTLRYLSVLLSIFATCFFQIPIHEQQKSLSFFAADHPKATIMLFNQPDGGCVVSRFYEKYSDCYREYHE